jgi:hypothetical protein
MTTKSAEDWFEKKKDNFLKNTIIWKKIF